MIVATSSIIALSDVSTPITLSSLAKDRSRFPICTFSVVNGDITVGVLEALAPIGKKKTVKIQLDDNSILAVAKGQKILLLDGGYCCAEELSSGKSLMPLYLYPDNNGHTLYQQVGPERLKAASPVDAQTRRKVNRMVAQYKLGDALSSGTSVSHIDLDKKNCHPDNLKVEVNPEKRPRKFMHPFIKAVKDAHEFIKTQPKNHKVVAVYEGDEESVYGLVSRSENIAVGGVFLHTIEEE